MRFNGDATSSRHKSQLTYGKVTAVAFNESEIEFMPGSDNTVGTGLFTVFIPDYTNTTTWKMAQIFGITVNSSTTTNFDCQNSTGFYNQTAAISSLRFHPNFGNFTSGTILLYGVK
jgi:hypothetical protein